MKKDILLNTPTYADSTDILAKKLSNRLINVESCNKIHYVALERPALLTCDAETSIFAHVHTRINTHTHTIRVHVKIPINIEPTVITWAISVKHTRKQRKKAEREGRKKGGRKGHEIVVGNNNENQ